MSVHLSALAVRARFIATVAAVLVAAMVVITGRAEAADVSGTPVLAQGAGMAAKPSAAGPPGAAGACGVVATTSAIAESMVASVR